MTGAGTAVRRRCRTVTTWTTTRTTWPRWSSTSVSGMRCTWATRPAGGGVVRYLARHGEERTAKAVLIAAVPPLMVQTDANPGGLPKSVFGDFQAQLAANR